MREIEVSQITDVVERLCVIKSRQYLDASDIVIVVVDGTSVLDDEDYEVLKATESKKRIILINKSDMDSVLSKADFDGDIVVEISAKTGEGTQMLEDEIEKLCRLGEIESENGRIITNMRHKTALLGAADALNASVSALKNAMPSDIVSIDIVTAVDCLGEITGETVSDSVVNEIFHNFCVGK